MMVWGDQVWGTIMAWKEQGLLGRSITSSPESASISLSTIIPWGPQDWDCPSWGTSRASPHTTSISLMGCPGGNLGQKGPLAVALPHSADLGTVFCAMGIWSRCSAPTRAWPGVFRVSWDRMGAGCEKEEEEDGWQPPRCPSGDARGKKSDWRA